MVEVSTGAVGIGSNDKNGLAFPLHSENLATFWIQKYEVSNGDYKRCYEAGICTQPEYPTNARGIEYFTNSAFSDYPVFRVSYYQARQYCTEYLGKQFPGSDLPTEYQWEKAARGNDGRTYPWHDPSITADDANVSSGDARQVGSFDKDLSPYGVYDMAGNVSEWTLSWLVSYQYNPELFDNTNVYIVVRGGNYASGDGTGYPKVYWRQGKPPELQSPTVGFRCAWQPAAQAGP
jgi:formylglycine-generating enzyme required for sulfatase activity